ncbi:hypothetical protein [Terriglobus roseus]|uniref:hypothetical protein n=1 Tax=Terriglobus roseus TaxID=392734 RepID=UPI000313D042|nr:hypothetical protein [Terriglobus roseus]
MSTDALASFRLRKIGFTFQDFHLFPHLDFAQNVAVPLILHYFPWNKAVEDAKLLRA